jgi:probable HAF family extracellular repeat protein
LHGFLDSGGAYTTIDPPGSFTTTVTAINAKGQIVGSYQESGGGPEHSFVYSGGTYTILNVPGGTDTTADSINNKGQIVGSYLDGSGQQHGFVYSGGTYTTIDPSGIGSGPNAFSINNSGQIVGPYFGNGTEHGFLANPAGHQRAPDSADIGIALLNQYAAAGFHSETNNGGNLTSPQVDSRGEDKFLATPHQ